MKTAALIKHARLAVRYGMGPTRLAAQLTTPRARVTRKNATRLVSNFHQAWPELSAFFKTA